MKKNRAIFLDRDGTLNEDPGYLNHPGQMKLLPHVGEALKKFTEAGFQLVVVSNQSGVARGLVRKEDLPRIHAKLNELLAPYGVKIEHFYFCTHHPDHDCECRKPKPKLVLDAARDLHLEVSESYMIGDKLSDLEVGRAAGCKGAGLVRTGTGRETELKLKPNERPDFVGDDLLELYSAIVRN